MLPLPGPQTICPDHRRTSPQHHLQVPLLATCQLVQRMLVAAVGAERERAAAEAAALRKEVAHLRAAAPGAAAVAEQ